MNNQQSSVEWLAEEFANHIEDVYSMKITNLTLLAKAKLIQQRQAQDYAQYSINCHIENVARLDFNTWIYQNKIQGGNK